MAVEVNVSWKPSCNVTPYPGSTPYRGCHVSSREIIERTMENTLCCVSQRPFVALLAGSCSAIMPSEDSSVSQYPLTRNRLA